MAPLVVELRRPRVLTISCPWILAMVFDPTVRRAQSCSPGLAHLHHGPVAPECHEIALLLHLDQIGPTWLSVGTEVPGSLPELRYHCGPDSTVAELEL